MTTAEPTSVRQVCKREGKATVRVMISRERLTKEKRECNPIRETMERVLEKKRS